MPEWWDKNKKIPFHNENFVKILDFYLFHCPSEITKKKGTAKIYTRVSKRAKTLRSQGWIEGYANTLIACMKRNLKNPHQYCVCNSNENIAEKTEELESSCTLSDKHFEMLVITERHDMNKASAIFYYIRNAFAHASFSVITVNNRNIYYFESKKDETVKARIRLNENTLLEWIKDFSLSPAKLKALLSDERKQKKKKLLSA